MSVIDAATLEFANRLADAAGAVIRPYFRRPLAVIDKGQAAFDPVTEADRGAETACARSSRASGPTMRSSARRSASRRARSVGTDLGARSGRRHAGLHHRRHTWGTLIALEETGGACSASSTSRCCATSLAISASPDVLSPDAVRGAAADPGLCGPRPGRCVSSRPIPGAISTPPNAGASNSSPVPSRMSYFGGDCYAYALLAMGHVDLVSNPG